jgi:hypothetical protein
MFGTGATGYRLRRLFTLPVALAVPVGGWSER